MGTVPAALAAEAAVAGAWGVGASRSAALPAAGTVNRTVLLTTEGGRFVLRASRPRDRTAVDREHALIAHAVARGVPAVAPVPLPGGGTVLERDGRCFALFPWAAGRQVARADAGEAGAAMGVALAAPLAPVALPVCGALCATLGRSWRVKAPAYAACALPAAGAAAWLAAAPHAGGAAPAGPALVAGYLDPLLAAGRLAAGTWPAVDWGRALAALEPLWPYSAALGPLAGLGAFGFVSCGGWLRGAARNELRVVEADDLAKLDGKPEPQPVGGFAAVGRLTAVTALPKQGKTFAWFGLLKARQGGGAWFGRKAGRWRRARPW